MSPRLRGSGGSSGDWTWTGIDAGVRRSRRSAVQPGNGVTSVARGILTTDDDECTLPREGHLGAASQNPHRRWRKNSRPEGRIPGENYAVSAEPVCFERIGGGGL